MSADSWAKCPKCGGTAIDKRQEVADKLADAYGKVTSSEYLDMLAEAQTIEYDDAETLREDYEIGIFDGEFFVKYCGHCEKCGFEYNFKYSDRITDEPE